MLDTASRTRQKNSSTTEATTGQPPMPGAARFIAQRPLRLALEQRYGLPDGYFWDALEHLPEYQLHGRLSWRRIAAISSSAIQLLRARSPFVLFTDHGAGWSQVPKQKRCSPAQFNSPDEASTFVRIKSHFRDGTSYEDNYYLCDSTLEWFICFCHHDGWHLWLPKRATLKAAWPRWQRKMGVKQIEVGSR